MSHKSLIYILATLSVIVVLAVTGCKSKQTTKTTGQVTTESLTTADLISNVLASQPSYDNINISQLDAQLNYDGRTFTVRCNVKVVRDESITISVLPLLGIEIYRLVLTPKKVTVLDKLNRQYCETDFSLFEKELGTPLSFQTIQGLLTAQLVTVDGATTAAALKRAFFSEKRADKFILTADKKIGTKQHIVDVSPNYQLTKSALNENSLDIVAFSYSNYQQQGGISFPRNISVAMIAPNRTVNFDMTINKIEFNKLTETTSLDLTRYNKVTCHQLLP